MHNTLGFNTSPTPTNFGASFIGETKKKLSSLGNNPKVGRIALGTVALLAVAGGVGYGTKTLWNGQSQLGGFNSTQTNTTGNFTSQTQTNTTLGNLTSVNTTCGNLTFVNTTNLQNSTTNSSYNSNPFFSVKDLSLAVANFTNTSVVNETECQAGLIAVNTTLSSEENSTAIEANSTDANSTTFQANTTKTVANTTETVANTTETVANTTEAVANTTEAVANTTKTVANTTETVANTTETVANSTETVAPETLATSTNGTIANVTGNITTAAKINKTIADEILNTTASNTTDINATVAKTKTSAPKARRREKQYKAANVNTTASNVKNFVNNTNTTVAKNDTNVTNSTVAKNNTNVTNSTVVKNDTNATHTIEPNAMTYNPVNEGIKISLIFGAPAITAMSGLVPNRKLIWFGAGTIGTGLIVEQFSSQIDKVIDAAKPHVTALSEKACDLASDGWNGASQWMSPPNAYYVDTKSETYADVWGGDETLISPELRDLASQGLQYLKDKGSDLASSAQKAKNAWDAVSEICMPAMDFAVDHAISNPKKTGFASFIAVNSALLPHENVALRFKYFAGTGVVLQGGLIACEAAISRIPQLPSDIMAGAQYVSDSIPAEVKQGAADVAGVLAQGTVDLAKYAGSNAWAFSKDFGSKLSEGAGIRAGQLVNATGSLASGGLEVAQDLLAKGKIQGANGLVLLQEKGSEAIEAGKQGLVGSFNWITTPINTFATSVIGFGAVGTYKTMKLFRIIK